MAYNETPYRKDAMFAKDARSEKLDEAIANVFSEMTGFTADSDEYAAMSEQLERLYRLKDLEKSRNRVSPDALATIAANLIGIGIIIGHERAHVITSKAFSHILKLR